MTRQTLLNLCLTYPNAYEDYPFRDDNWAVVRQGPGGKIFAFIYERNNQLCINLKCEPMQADFYRSVYPSVIPGFHMNHHHWNTILMDGSVPQFELEAMVADSYRLTRPKK